jgi:UDP-N-acetylglucosamine--N-acetylmuramyl-(pentapeptide) pyrophosphoryl-undecaprenol N-acetylglucosamine transferase
MKKYDFMILAGGTGGHIFPAAAVACELVFEGSSVCWAGKIDSLEEKQAKLYNIDFIVSNSPVWQRRGRLARIYVIFELLKAIYLSWGIMKHYNPKVVIGFGGAISVALGICAALQGKKLLLHEQNAKAGKANKLLSLFATKIILGFPGTFKNNKNVVIAGNPVRQDLVADAAIKATQKRVLSSPFKILVLGGSQGSDGLNKVVVEAFSNLGQDFEIWHQAGAKNVESTTKAYEDIKKDAHVVEFIDNMREAYMWSDLVISRAGALTITEILAYKLPSILVPNPHSADNHQYANAHYIARHNAAVVVDEKSNAAAEIAASVLYMLSNPKYYFDMVTATSELAVTDATAKIAQICLDKYLVESTESP